MRNVVVALALLASVSAFAEETGGEEHHGAEEGHHKHTLDLFVGVTREHGEDLATLGIEYSYRFFENWTAGAVLERADRDQDSTLAIAFLHFWPWKGLYLGGGLAARPPATRDRTRCAQHSVTSSNWRAVGSSHHRPTSTLSSTKKTRRSSALSSASSFEGGFKMVASLRMIGDVRANRS